MTYTIKVNGAHQTFTVDGDTPLLWVLRDALGLTGTKYGCGIAVCGACTVHVDGKPARSCMLPIESVGEPFRDLGIDLGSMNSSISISPTVAGLRLVVSMVASLSSVGVIVQINPVRLAALTIRAENQPPLLIDTDRMKPRQIAAQLLEVNAGRNAQVLIGHGIERF